jgi:hypothetical protein
MGNAHELEATSQLARFPFRRGSFPAGGPRSRHRGLLPKAARLANSTCNDLRSSYTFEETSDAALNVSVAECGRELLKGKRALEQLKQQVSGKPVFLHCDQPSHNSTSFLCRPTNGRSESCRVTRCGAGQSSIGDCSVAALIAFVARIKKRSHWHCVLGNRFCSPASRF